MGSVGVSQNTLVEDFGEIWFLNNHRIPKSIINARVTASFMNIYTCQHL